MTLQEIKEHQDQFGTHDLDTMSTSDYRQVLDDGAFFWIDHHECLRNTFSGEIIASNIMQIDLLIAYMENLKIIIRDNNNQGNYIKQ